MRHLLLIGRHIDQLMELAIRLRSFSRIMTVALTDDLVIRARQSAKDQREQAIVCLNEQDVEADVTQLIEISPLPVFVTSERAQAVGNHLRQHGCLVLADRDAGAVIAATLTAYERAPALPTRREELQIGRRQ